MCIRDRNETVWGKYERISLYIAENKTWKVKKEFVTTGKKIENKVCKKYEVADSQVSE